MNSASDTDSPELQQQKKVKLESALKVLPKMQHGLDVNVRFTGVSAFEYTEEMTIFDALGIGLYHGWLVEPQDSNYAYLSTKSYDDLVVILVPDDELMSHDEMSSKTVEDSSAKSSSSSSSSSCSSKATRQAKETEVAIVDSFLNDTANQLTNFGLISLYREVNNGEVCILFRNNHFSTMFKRNNYLYLLQTDDGYREIPDVVWEVFDDISGNTTLKNSFFEDSLLFSENVHEWPTCSSSSCSFSSCYSCSSSSTAAFTGDAGGTFFDLSFSSTAASTGGTGGATPAFYPYP